MVVERLDSGLWMLLISLRVFMMGVLKFRGFCGKTLIPISCIWLAVIQLATGRKHDEMLIEARMLAKDSPQPELSPMLYENELFRGKDGLLGYLKKKDNPKYGTRFRDR